MVGMPGVGSSPLLIVATCMGIPRPEGEIGCGELWNICSMVGRLGGMISTLDPFLEATRLLVDVWGGAGSGAVRRMITRMEAYLDPDGVAPREDEARARASLTLFERDGMLHLSAVLDPERAAAVKTAIEGYVSAQFAARRDRDRDAGQDSGLVDADRRTVGQIQADALAGS